MPTPAVAPFVLKDSIFKVALDNYEAHVSQVQFTPSASTSSWQGLTPTSSFTDVSSATWVCTLAYAQDWETANSLARYLFEHEGVSVDVEFEPIAGGPSFTATLIITPGQIGGTVNQWATGTVSLGVSGRPELVAA